MLAILGCNFIEYTILSLEVLVKHYAFQISPLTQEMKIEVSDFITKFFTSRFFMNSHFFSYID